MPVQLCIAVTNRSWKLKRWSRVCVCVFGCVAAVATDSHRAVASKHVSGQCGTGAGFTRGIDGHQPSYAAGCGTWRGRHWDAGCVCRTLHGGTGNHLWSVVLVCTSLSHPLRLFIECFSLKWQTKERSYHWSHLIQPDIIWTVCCDWLQPWQTGSLRSSRPV